MKSYTQRKDEAREQAIQIQEYLADARISYGELSEIQSRLERIARRYGLVKEFRENGLL